MKRIRALDVRDEKVTKSTELVRMVYDHWAHDNRAIDALLLSPSQERLLRNEHCFYIYNEDRPVKPEEIGRLVQFMGIEVLVAEDTNGA